MMKRRYNVLHIISDQHLASCAGYEGHQQAITPNLDRMAAQGVRFSKAYSQCTICTPSRVSILSGQYCHNHGYYGNHGPTPKNLPNYLGHFKANGYRTAAIGKLHVPNDPVHWLLEDVHYWRDCYQEPANRRLRRKIHSHYYTYLDALGLLDEEDSHTLPELAQQGILLDEARPSDLPYEHSPEGWCVREAIKFMAESADTPFCMQVSFPRPHQKYTPDQRFWDLYSDDLDLPETINQAPEGRSPVFQELYADFHQSEGAFEPRGFESYARRLWRGYLACIAQVDHAVGELCDYLKQTGQEKDTIVIYNADHGAFAGTFGLAEKVPGISSEAVCRVPFLWRSPDAITGHVSQQLVENVDIAATITSLCGLPAMETVDGADITELLNGTEAPVREVAVTENVWSKALRWGPWRFVHYQPGMYDHTKPPNVPYDKAAFHDGDVGELYDLTDDPLEQNNLYHDPQYKDVLDRSRRHLLEWLIGTSRVVSMWPSPHYPELDYETAGDGRMSNASGPEYLARKGMVEYL